MNRLFALVLAVPLCLSIGQAVAAEAPTFSRDVAPILFKDCASCHRPGAIAPFPLLTYADARKRAVQIARVVDKGVMPPWKPVAGIGEFLSDRHLTDAQKAVFREWAEAGAPEGDPKDLPPAPRFKEGWQLGKPDLILKMPKPYTVRAEGQDPYVHFVFPLDLKDTVYLRGVEVRPGNPRVMHHAVGILDASGSARRIAKRDGDGVAYEKFGGPGFLPSGFTPGFAPGQTMRFLEDETAITLKPGTDFILQAHYHPIGKEEIDQTEVGLYFSKMPPKRKLSVALLGGEDIDIPAGCTDYTVADDVKLGCDLEATGIWAHMHMIGRTVEAWAELPDGKRVDLLQIADWDFNWQDTYLYRKPIHLPKGTVLKCLWTFDNSSAHPRNPFQPPRRIKHGPNSTDEMTGLVLSGIVADWPEELAMAAVNVGHYLEVVTRTKGRRVQR